MINEEYDHTCGIGRENIRIGVYYAAMGTGNDWMMNMYI